MAIRLDGIEAGERVENWSGFYAQLHKLTATILQVIDATISKVKLSPYAKWWWSQELAQHQTQVRRAAWRDYSRRADLLDPANLEHKLLHNSHGVMIEKAKKDHCQDFLEGLDERTMWMVHKYALGEPSDVGRAHVPTLKVKQEDSTFRMAASNDEKSGAFTSTFFLDMECTAEPHNQQSYPTPKFTFSPITDTQIERAIKWLSPYKAPGADGIPNVVFIQCANLQIPHLGPLFRATFEFSVYPSEWRDSTTVVVRKLGKPD